MKLIVSGRRMGKTEAIKEFKREQMEAGKSVRILTASSASINPIIELEPQSSTPADSELLIEFLEFWLEAGRLQDFDSRQEFRRHAREILLAMKGSK